MYFDVRTPSGKNANIGLAAYATMASNFFCKQLGINRLQCHVTLTMHQKLYIDGKGTEGSCEPISDRVFNVDVALYGNWLSTLAHELVHVKQFARGELDDRMTRWKTNKYCENIDYWDQPWEKEARRLQTKLMGDFEKFMME